MPLASSSSVQVRAIKEVTFGVIPVAGNPLNLRVTGETLNFDISKEQSKEINATRTVSSVVPVTAKSSGGVNMEVSYASIEPFLESTLQNSFVEFGTDGVGIATATTSISATLITATAATTGVNLFTLLQPGQWFRIASAGNNNGKILRVSTITPPTSTVITLDVNTPGTVSAGESIQIQSARLSNGTNQTSWTIERNNTDIGVFIAYTGMTPSKVDIKVASGSLSEINFDFVGKSGLESNATLLPGTPIAPSNYDIHSGVGGATNAVWMDGVPLTGTYVKSVALSYDNALRSQEAVGTLGAVAVGSGTINLTGQLEVYFADKNLFTKFRQNTNTSLIFSSTDVAGNGYIFTIPVANISTWKSNASAKDQDQMVSIDMFGLNDSGNAVVGLRKAILIDRVGVAVV